MSQQIEYTELQMAKSEFKDSTKYTAAAKGEAKMNLNLRCSNKKRSSWAGLKC